MGLTNDDIKGFGADAKRQITAQLLKKGETAPKASKYHAEKDERAGIKFDSKKEARRFDELMLLYKSGEIRKLKVHPEYTLLEAYTALDGEKIRALKYVADFSYERNAGTDTYGYQHWVKVTEDTKGVLTSDYKIKRKLFKEKYGYSITEV